MALLQLTLPQCTSPTFAVLSSDPSVRRPCSVQMGLKARPSAICRASSSNGNAGLSSDDECAQTPMIFKDESQGIVCYYNENGELTCEGWDEGPHFQPEPQQFMTRRRRIFLSRAMQVKGSGDGVGFKATVGKMGESLREGKAVESYNCSEL